MKASQHFNTAPVHSKDSMLELDFHQTFKKYNTSAAHSKYLENGGSPFSALNLCRCVTIIETKRKAHYNCCIRTASDRMEFLLRHLPSY